MGTLERLNTITRYIGKIGQKADKKRSDRGAKTLFNVNRIHFLP